MQRLSLNWNGALCIRGILGNVLAAMPQLEVTMNFNPSMDSLWPEQWGMKLLVHVHTSKVASSKFCYG